MYVASYRAFVTEHTGKWTQGYARRNGVCFEESTNGDPRKLWES